MKFTSLVILIIFFISFHVKADEVKDWLKTEIDQILNVYKNDSLSKIDRFKYIEETINQNFAGSGIAKFVAGKAWSTADKETKKNYIKLFKRHLALNIASMMKAYSSQTYSLNKPKQVEVGDVILIDMEITSETNKLLITWRVKKSKNRYFIIDLLVADISLVVTKRSEFNSLLKKADFDLKKFNETLHDQNESSYKKIIQ